MDEEKDIRKLALHAAALIQVFGEMWEAYEELFRNIDLDNGEVAERSLGAILELEHNLTDVLDQIRGQIYIMTGVYEPVPVGNEDMDLESSVLSDISKLGEIDLEQFRIPDLEFDVGDVADDDERDDESSDIERQWAVDDLQTLTKDQLIDMVTEIRTFLEDFYE
jgi:hypothetical protein